MASETPNLHVLIVGGGIGGLMLGIMLERAGIDYQILERSPEHRPLGSAISLNGTVLRLFEQLGLLEELYKISKFAGRLHVMKEDLETQGHLDLEHFEERYGYNSIVFGRPDLFKMLVSHIPEGKLLMGKRVLSTTQIEGEGVQIRCSDGSTYRGDILVGADGAYSSVRQCMHKALKEKGLLPKSDSEKLKFDQHCVVGITDELDPERFPILKQEFCELYGIIGKKSPYTIWLIPIVGNRFAWSIGGRILDSEAGQEDVRSFSFAEWWPELTTDVCDLVRDYTLPDFRVSYQHDGHYKNASVAHHDVHHHHDELHDIHDSNHPFSDEGSSVSDCSSIHSKILSESGSSPISSSASSAMMDDPVSPGKHPHPPSYSAHFTQYETSCASKWKSPHPSPLSSPPLLSPSPLPSPTTNTNTVGDSAASSINGSSHSSHADSLPHGFTPRRKTHGPAKPGTVGEIIDATNMERISKVMLESKLFKVWHHERTVLIGDACHKILPFAGQGAIQAILDGISLANALYDMKTKSMDNITRAFKRYSSERFPIAKGAVVGSRSFGRFLNVQGRLSDFIHKISFSRVPPWLLRMATDKLHLNRPQLTYLPMVPDRGAAKAHKQDYSPKYLARMANERQRASSSEASLVATAATANGISNSNATSFEKHHEPHGQFKQQQQQQQQQPQRFAPGEEGQEEGEHYRVGARRQRPRSKSHHHPRSPTSSIFSSKEILPPIGAPLSPSSSRKMSPRSLVPPPLPLEAPPRHHPTVYLHHHAPSSSRSSSSQTSPYSSSYSLAATTSPGVEEGYFSHHSSRSRRNTVGQNGRSQPSSPRAGVPPLAPFASLPIPFETLSRSPDVYAHGATTTTTTMTCTPPRSPTNATNYSERVTALLNRPSTTPIAPLTGPMAPTMTSASTPSTPIAASFKRRHMRTKSLHLEDNESLMAEILALERTTAMMKERALLREKRSLDQINTQWRQQQQYYQRLRHQHSHPLQQQQQQQQDQQQHQTQLRQPQPLSYHKLQQQRAELEQSSQL